MRNRARLKRIFQMHRSYALWRDIFVLLKFTRVLMQSNVLHKIRFFNGTLNLENPLALKAFISNGIVLVLISFLLNTIYFKSYIWMKNTWSWSTISPRVHRASKIDLTGPQGDYGQGGRYSILPTNLRLWRVKLKTAHFKLNMYSFTRTHFNHNRFSKASFLWV